MEGIEPTLAIDGRSLLQRSGALTGGMRLVRELMASDLVQVVIIAQNGRDAAKIRDILANQKMNKADIAEAGGESIAGWLRRNEPDLFASHDEAEVEKSVGQNTPAVQMRKTPFRRKGAILRIAFDFDGVLADREDDNYFARLYKWRGRAIKFLKAVLPAPLKRIVDDRTDPWSKEFVVKIYQEKQGRLLEKGVPIKIGPLFPFAQKTSETIKARRRAGLKETLRIDLITARTGKALERAKAFLKSYSFAIDEENIHSTGLESKTPQIVRGKIDIFFDDGTTHIERAIDATTTLQVPHGRVKGLARFVEPSEETQDKDPKDSGPKQDRGPGREM